MRTSLALLLILTIIVSGCATLTAEKINPVQPQKNEAGFQIMLEYTVVMNNTWSSSGGDRAYNIRYGVKNEEYTFCEGKYQFSGGLNQKSAIECTLNELKTNRRTFYDAYTMSGIEDRLKKNYGIMFENLTLNDNRCWSGTVGEWNDTKIMLCLDEKNQIISFQERPRVYGGEYNWRVEK